jgi:hypothetical protein
MADSTASLLVVLVLMLSLIHQTASETQFLRNSRAMQEVSSKAADAVKGLITAKTRYITLYTYSDNKCEEMVMAEIHPLNVCAPSKKGGYVKYFAFVHPTNKHIEMTKSYFSDQQCTTKALSSTKTISSSTCVRVDLKDSYAYIKGAISKQPVIPEDAEFVS